MPMGLGMTDRNDASLTELLVCVTCRRADAVPCDDRRPGQALYDGIMALDHPQGLRVTPTECLQNCDRGCTIALRGGARKWTYVFAALDETAHAPMILDGAAQYHAAPDGLIPWRERPQHFKRNCVARIPPLTAPERKD